MGRNPAKVGAAVWLSSATLARKPGGRASVGRDLAGADARVRPLRLQQQLHALDRRDRRLGHGAGHAAGQQVTREGRPPRLRARRPGAA